jgi:membrane protein YdbS with pleckstrin-like domain
MGLPADQLGTDEHVVLETREHWKHLLGAALICLAALVGLVLVLAVGPESGFFGWVDKFGWLAFIGVVAVFGFWPWLEWHRRSYTLTNRRLATRKGVIRRSGRDIPLMRINDVAFEQGVLDRMVHSGTLRVSAASEEGIIVLRDIPRIHEFTRALNELVRAAR